MTLAEYEKMTDLELDALVAEKVMGWTLADRVESGWGHGPPVWLTGEDPEREDSNPTWQDFRPSTSISHAFEVVEKMTTDTKQWFRLEKCSTFTTAVFERSGDGDRDFVAEYTFTGDYETPRAICIAALLAKEVENGH